MTRDADELVVSVEEATAPQFRGRLLARGQAQSMIRRDGVLPDEAPQFSPYLDDECWPDSTRNDARASRRIRVTLAVVDGVLNVMVRCSVTNHTGNVTGAPSRRSVVRIPVCAAASVSHACAVVRRIMLGTSGGRCLEERRPRGSRAGRSLSHRIRR
jgi:hypothetical protein